MRYKFKSENQIKTFKGKHKLLALEIFQVAYPKKQAILPLI
jgi:hypothetical protein